MAATSGQPDIHPERSHVSKPASPETVLYQEKEKARLKGESDGRTMGRIDERCLIVRWLRRQRGMEAWRLANLIEDGIHMEAS